MSGELWLRQIIGTRIPIYLALEYRRLYNGSLVFKLFRVVSVVS